MESELGKGSQEHLVMQTQSKDNNGDAPATLSSKMHMESELGKGSNEHLKIQTQSRQSDGDPAATFPNQIHIESELWRERNEQLKIQTQSRQNGGNPPPTLSSQTHMESEIGGGSNEHLKMQTQSRHNDCDPPAEAAALGFSLSPSSSPSSSSSGSPFGDDDPLSDFLTKSEQDGSRSPAPEPLFTPDFPIQTPGWSMVSATPRNGNGNLTSSEIFSENVDWSNFNASPMRSPPVQTMGQPASYDPNRIPASIFASKPATPMEWSVASNESLFSIHMGNNSFSRDHVILLGKSGELTKPEERNNSPPNSNYVSEAKHNEVKNFSSSLPPLIEVASDNKGKSVNMKADPVVEEDPSKNLKAIAEENRENHDNKVSPVEEVHSPSGPSNISGGKGLPPVDRARTSSSPPRLSNESGKSSSSFAFPVLVNEVGRTVSLKAVSEKPEEPQISKATPKEAPKEAPKAAGTSWFYCFACWPRCC